MSHKALTLMLIFAAVPVAALILIPGLSGRPSRGPQTIEEATELARSHGLYWASPFNMPLYAYNKGW